MYSMICCRKYGKNKEENALKITLNPIISSAISSFFNSSLRVHACAHMLVFYKISIVPNSSVIGPFPLFILEEDS